MLISQPTSNIPYKYSFKEDDVYPISTQSGQKQPVNLGEIFMAKAKKHKTLST